MLQLQSRVVATDFWPTKPEIFTIWVIIGEVCKPLIINHKENKLLIQNNLLSTLTKENTHTKKTLSQVSSFCIQLCIKSGLALLQSVL